MKNIINIIIKTISIITLIYNFVKYNLNKDNLNHTYKNIKNFILLSIKYSDFLRTNKEEIIKTFIIYPVIFVDTKNITYVIVNDSVTLINKFELKNNSLKDAILESDFIEENNKVKDIIKNSNINYTLIFQDNKSYKINLMDIIHEL